METPAVVPATLIPEKPRATAYEIASWLIVASALIFILFHHLLSALLSGLFVYAMVHRIAGRLSYLKMAGHKAKLLAMLILSLAVVGLSAGIVIAVISMARGRVGDMPEMMHRMSEVVDQFRDWFTSKGIGGWIPDAETLHARALTWLHENSAGVSSKSGTMLLHSIIGIVIGAMLSFHISLPGGPLAAAFFERVRRFAKAFEQVFFAQVKISALNTLFTAIYLLVVLPIFGVHLPFRSTLVGVTFIAGLIPVIGNLISNAVIVLISLGLSAGVAAASLIFLVVIHKLEYFLNAKIVGGEIHAAAWEILLAMLCFESAFGIPGVIVAPIAYAYFKAELKDKQLI